MSNVFSCGGCDSIGFTWRGFVQHVRHSKDELCRIAFEDKFGFKDTDDLIEQGPIIPFAGDALGSAADYLMDDFGQGSDEEAGPVDVGVDAPNIVSDPNEDPIEVHMHTTDNEEDDERETRAELENGWEPERPNAPLNTPVEDTAVEDMVSDPTSNDNSNIVADQLRNERSQAEHAIVGEAGHGPTPKVRVRFSEKHRSSQCGQKRQQCEALDSRYQSHVNGEANPWAPFHSKLDWEMAKWAKLRGPGSTSFSDLLAIDGVSLVFFDVSTCSTILSRSWKL